VTPKIANNNNNNINNNRGVTLNSGPRDTESARAIWQSLGESADPSTYSAQAQDLVEQVASHKKKKWKKLT